MHAKRIAMICLGAACLFAQPAINTFAGRDPVFEGDGMPGVNDKIGLPRAIALDARGNVYFTDSARIPAVIDIGAHGRSQEDGWRLTEVYQELGLELLWSTNAEEGGTAAVWDWMASHRYGQLDGLRNHFIKARPRPPGSSRGARGRWPIFRRIEPVLRTRSS